MTSGRAWRALPGLLAVAWLAACGGGGGGSAPPASPAVIDGTSAPVITRQVILVGFGAADFGAVLGGSGLVSASGGSNALGQQLARRQALAAGGAMPSAVLGPETVDCLVSGTVRLSGTLSSEETLTPGDRLSATFTTCDDGDAAVYDGRLDLAVTDFNGDLFTGAFFLAAGMTLGDLRISDATGVATANGDMDLELDLRLPDQPLLAASGQRLAIGTDEGTWTLSDFALSLTEDPGLGGGGLLVYRSAAGTLEGPGFTGAADFLTVEPLAMAEDGTIVSGEILITGAGGATIRVTAAGTGSLQLGLDLDGDGQVDETQVLVWEQ